MTEIDLPAVLRDVRRVLPLPDETAIRCPAGGVCLANIHALPVPGGHRLQQYLDPGPPIVAESRESADACLKRAGAPAASRTALERADVFAQPELAIANYDVNTHNIIVDDDRASLVDWERARVAPAVQDLAHFLLPTTTRLTGEQVRRFLDAYLRGRPGLDRATLERQLVLMKRCIALRAVSWRSWALHGAATGSRAFANAETVDTGRMCLRPDF